MNCHSLQLPFDVEGEASRTLRGPDAKRCYQPSKQFGKRWLGHPEAGKWWPGAACVQQGAQPGRIRVAAQECKAP